MLTLGVSAVTAMPASAAGMASDVAQALKLRLPKTPIDAISCDTLGPWCEVVSGDTLFYIDETARYLFVGRLYDMEERRDVTAARLLELNPDLLAAGAARVASDAPAGRDEAPVQAAANHVDLSSLPAAGAIHWGNLKGERLVVFSDFQCGYCQRLTAELAKAKVARRRATDLDLWRGKPQDFRGGAVRQGSGKGTPCGLFRPGSGECQDLQGRQGTRCQRSLREGQRVCRNPVIVRARDGAVLHGYRDAAAIRRFVAEGGSGAMSRLPIFRAMVLAAPLAVLPVAAPASAATSKAALPAALRKGPARRLPRSMPGRPALKRLTRLTRIGR